MAYTLQRLEQAIELFRSPSARLFGTLADECKYSLRTRPSKGKQVIPSCWLDDDSDSDYSPGHETSISKRKRASRTEDSTRPKKQARNPEQLIVIMVLKSITGRAFLAALPMSEADIPAEDNEQLVQYWNIADCTVESASNSRYSLRKRESPQEGNDRLVDLDEAAAKGCWACRKIHQDCSLLEHQFAYPCQTCKEDNIDCELIIPPEWKRACERCRRSGRTCSYSYGETDHSVSCEQCQATGIPCIAGPAKSKPPLEPRTKAEKGERCAGFRDSGSIWDTIPPLPANDEPDDPVSFTSTPKNCGSRIIHTSLAHPVDFAYEPPTDGTNPCHWCINFVYGIMGLGRKAVEVIDFGDGRYVEIKGGHVKDGHEPSRMCVTCALERIHIVNCSRHYIVPLKGYKVDTFDFDAAYNSLIPIPGQPRKRINPWCSLCPNPAFFGCNTLQLVNKYQEPVAPTSPHARGCGLLLCERCELLMRAYRGNLAKVVAKNDQANAEAATRRAQLTVTTSSTKRRKVAEPRRPGGALPGLSFASQAGRRHSQHPHSDSSSVPPNPRPSSTSGSNRSQSPSVSPSPRYIPAHLQEEVLGTAARSPTSESASTADYPSIACAGLTLYSDAMTDMSGSDKGDGSAPPPGGDVRSSSPGIKRSAPNADQDVEMDLGSTEKRSVSLSQHTDAMDTTTAEGSSNGNSDNSGSDNVYPTPSSMSTFTSPTATRKESKAQASGSSHDLPPIDDQVAQVTCTMAQPLKEKQKGYLVSMSWLKRVLARSSTHADKADKSAAEGDIGPVDNSDLVLVTDPAITGFHDEAGEPFVPLRPGLQMGEDFEIVPQEGWDLIMRWYGLANQSPAIVRYAHNTVEEGDTENIQYELHPPIFTVLKLANPAAGTTPQSLREKNMPPAKVLSSRHTNFQKWLKQVKGLANIDMSTKVRVWRILGGLGSATASAAITPAASRSASPAPTASLVANAGNNLVLDLNTFLSLSDGAQRELVDNVKDQTNNPNFNGRSTLDRVGLSTSDVVVLEERVGGEWASEVSKKTLDRLGVPSGSMKNGVPAKLKNKSPTNSGRSSPAPEPIRGRRKDGKPRGCTGLSNLGNTCYMNSALQCVRSVEELTYYFLNDVYKKDLNPSNPLAHNGDIAKAYANLLRMIYDEAGQSSFAPRQFKHTIGRYGPAFSGYGQQDSQEFLLFLLDGLQEDLNRIQKKPYIEKPDSTDDMVHDKKALKEFANKCWDIYKARNDSVITDLFAGMYKSTLVCPVCEKVSIIFDPFNNLTLQLPIENLWSKEIFFFPLHRKPVIVDVEIDKNASIKALKELVAKKMGSDPQRLVMAEIYKCKFYKMFDNSASIADCQIGQGDDIAIFEVESVPTNYNPDKRQKSYFSYGRSDYEEIPSFDSPKADRMLVPIFNRHCRPKSNNSGNKQRSLFGAPLYVVISREEAQNYDAILHKVLEAVATLTTRDILNEENIKKADEQGGTQEDSDTVVMNEDDAQSADSKIKTSSVDGEDGLVDVSMRDASDEMDTPSSQDTKRENAVLGPDSSIAPGLRSLFDMKIIKSSHEVVPLGWSSVDDIKDYPLMSSRVKALSSSKQKKTTSSTVTERKNSDDSDQDGSAGSASDSDSDMFSNVSRPKAVKTQTDERPLIRPGEGIVLDWNDQAHDALFGGDKKDTDGLRGTPTWTNVERIPDPELAKRRDLRRSRKKRGVTLYECLDEFNKEEILSENDAWYCPRCKEHRRASKKFELWKTPDILVMHLKRFSASRGFRDKLDVLVDFPVEELDMSDRVEAPEEGKSLIYDLFAVDNHYGGLGGGHYTAYAKNFMSGEWNEYNDSSVSRPIDPQSVVTPAAYLLFYRRRSDRPLGGKILEEIAESSTRPASEDNSPAGSRGQSPSGNGRRLGGSSRNGSSSALAGVGAAHQAGDGGLRTGIRARNEDSDDDDDESPPDYSDSPAAGEQSLAKANRLEGMSFDEDEFGDGAYANPLPYSSQPTWSFDRVTDAHGLSQMTTVPPGSISDDEDLFDDDASNKAVGGGDLSDSDLRLAALTGSPIGQGVFPGTPMEEEAPIQDIPPPLDGDDDEDLPVVELRVNDDDQIVSD
ncbi:probable ubiquitin carboxyl-terminal hydrolase 12 [Aspergillus udagawae]|nr:probable ubiquitin carboxyl-terminal hydrolase 12 [Aspergillus udagawae]